ncbi:MAG: hypothetical protein AAGE84_25760 [Cyanobacteria bacterium P01_G01_bin.39]
MFFHSLAQEMNGVFKTSMSHWIFLKKFLNWHENGTSKNWLSIWMTD